MKTVFIIEHSYEIDGHDETKFIGVYSTQEEADQAVNRLKDKPGFRDRPEGFYINEYPLNKDHWTEGYAVITTIEVKNKFDEWTPVQADCLLDGNYRIYEIHDNDSLGPFKHLDIVECEERDGVLYAVRLVNKNV